MDKKIVILGAGPTGIGSAYRLKELGYKNFQILEKENYVGGLSASHRDKKGFIWDTGGHVIHSHFTYFDKVINKYLKKERFIHRRESWIYFQNKFIPYPFQNYIHLLPPEYFLKCLYGLITRSRNQNPKNFL